MSKIVSVRLTDGHVRILNELMNKMQASSYGDVIRRLITSAVVDEDDDWKVELWRLSGTSLQRITKLLGRCTSPEEFFSTISTRTFLVKPALKRRGEVCLEFVIAKRPFVISVPLTGNLVSMVREIVYRLKHALERAFDEDDLYSAAVERSVEANNQT